MKFSPGYVATLIVSPLRFLYSRYATPDLVWKDDPKLSTIEIDTINNFNKIAIQAKPRILISRGEYTIQPSGLTDNMAEGSSSRDPGMRIERKLLLVSGVAQVLVEAVNEGTCEKIVEITENFLGMSGPMIMNYHGFKRFAMPMSVSACTPSREDSEIFQCTINVPWMKEMSFQTMEDGIEFKQFLLGITN